MEFACTFYHPEGTPYCFPELCGTFLCSLVLFFWYFHFFRTLSFCFPLCFVWCGLVMCLVVIVALFPVLFLAWCFFRNVFPFAVVMMLRFCALLPVRFFQECYCIFVGILCAFLLCFFCFLCFCIGASAFSSGLYYIEGFAKTLQQWVTNLFIFMNGTLVTFAIHSYSAKAGANISIYDIHDTYIQWSLEVHKVKESVCGKCWRKWERCEVCFSSFWIPQKIVEILDIWLQISPAKKTDERSVVSPLNNVFPSTLR